MIEAGAEELCFKRTRLLALLLHRSKVCVDRPLRRDLDQLFLTGERARINRTFAHEAFRNELSRLQGRQEDKRAKQEKGHRSHENSDGDQKAQVVDVGKQDDRTLLKNRS